MSINVMEITKVSKLDFGTNNPEIEKSMRSIAGAFIKGESDARALCELCYTIRENATDGKIKAVSWADFIQNSYGSRLTASSARKFAQMADVYEYSDRAKADESGFYTALWQKYPIGKLIILAPLDSDTHAKNGRSISGFMQYMGAIKNQSVAEPWLSWCERNKAQLDKIADLESKGDKDTADFIRAMLNDEPPRPVTDDDATGLVWLGVEYARAVTDSNLKEYVHSYVEEHMSTAETEKAEKAAEKKAKKAAEKSAEDKRQEAENALCAYLATMDEEEKPTELSKALAVLRALAKQAGEK